MIRGLILSLFLVLLIGNSLIASAQDNAQTFPPDVVAEIQSEMDALTERGLLPGMIVWLDAPEYQFAGASGFADVKNDMAMQPDGSFRIGSITKMFTATVIIQLAEDGVLSLDDPLEKWLPEVATQLPYGEQITLRHLLSHTSGVFHWADHESYYTDLFTQAEIDMEAGVVTLDCVERDPNETLTNYVYGKDAIFKPGERWSYSNTNYTLLGMVIETATDMPLAEAYRVHIYEPLGMQSTFLDCYDETVNDVVHGYTGTDEAMSDLTEFHESNGWASGGLVSTAPDLITFARGLYSGALFDNPESLEAMMTRTPNSTYGLGMALLEDYMGHTGWIAGYRSLLYYAPEIDTVVVMLYNNDGADPEQGMAQVLKPALPLLRAEN